MRLDVVLPHGSLVAAEEHLGDWVVVSETLPPFPHLHLLLDVRVVRVLAGLIKNLALLWVREHLVGSLDFNEAFWSLWVFVFIRVVLFCKVAVRALYFIQPCISPNT